MELGRAFGAALRRFRNRAGLSQEAFSTVSSRTYISTLERGQKSPTLEKVDEIASVLSVHPLSILASCYLTRDGTLTFDDLVIRMRAELMVPNEDACTTPGQKPCETD